MNYALTLSVLFNKFSKYKYYIVPILLADVLLFNLLYKYFFSTYSGEFLIVTNIIINGLLLFVVIKSILESIEIDNPINSNKFLFYSSFYCVFFNILSFSLL